MPFLPCFCALLYRIRVQTSVLLPTVVSSSQRFKHYFFYVLPKSSIPQPSVTGFISKSITWVFQNQIPVYLLFSE